MLWALALAAGFYRDLPRLDARRPAHFAEFPDVLPALLADALPVAEAPWSVAEWAVAPRFDNPRATV